MYPVPSKLAVLVAVVSIVSLANSSRVSAQTYDWTSLSQPSNSERDPDEPRELQLVLDPEFL